MLAALLFVGFRSVGPVPPLGGFLDPVRGVWALARASEIPREASGSIPGLTGELEVVYDDRAVPHIFAATPEDAYRVLGYVVARDRLFQLEIQTRAAAGTLAELLGPRALPADRLARRLGLAWSAERAWPALDSTSEEVTAMAAYADGVNAWIDQMGPEDLPVEYRLLNAWPQPWKPSYSLYLFRNMGYTLAYGTHELTRERIVTAIGRAATDALFPIHHPIQEPIEPGPGPYPRFDFATLPPPTTPSSTDEHGRAQASSTAATVRSTALVRARPRSSAAGSGEGAGSNNWAVSPRRSATGHALLAGDPHLELTLPSIWYEAHLVVPGHLDVYGVTLPGQPAIIMGFNRDVAWSFTNTGNDVLDFYRETVDDPAAPSQYRLDGQWRRIERRIEQYRGRRGELLAVDTIYHTHRGPMRRVDDRWLSMHWLVLESMEVDALLGIGRARSVDEWLDAMTRWVTPAQNGLVADRTGTIAIRSSGRFPVRPGDGLGSVVRDGSSSDSDWTGFWPLSRSPLARNPAQGYLASANQQPKDPRVDPGYLEASWFDPWRALRINALLRADSAVTVEAMRRYQTDPGSARADLLVPAILEAGEAAVAAEAADGADGELREALRLLGEWDRRYTRDNTRAVLFEMVVSELQRRVWDELAVPVEGGDSRRIATPRESILLGLLRDPRNTWWDDRGTPARVETRGDVVAASLVAALAETRRRHGEPNGSGWRWDVVHQANIPHLLRIASFSALDLALQGGPSTLNPSSGDGTHGSSWRMVVELGPELRGWGTYPGGQSANPVSARYLDRLPKWLEGELDPLFFPRSAREVDASRVSARLRLRPGA